MSSSPDPFDVEAQHPEAGLHGLNDAATGMTQPEFFAPPPPEPNRFFFGRFGLRAGYGILLIVLTIALVSFVSQILAFSIAGLLPQIRAAQAYAQAHPRAPRHHVEIPAIPTLAIVPDGGLFLGLLGVCWLFARGERRPLRSYGLAAYRAADVLPGAFWGLAILSGVVAVLRALHLLVFDSQAVTGIAAVVYGAKWLLAFLCVGLAEEYVFRGYIQFALLRGFWGLAERVSPSNTRTAAYWLAAGATSLIFAYTHSHNAGENLFGLFQVFVAGVVFAYALWRTGSLWWGIGFHMTWDWAQSFLFGVADSGQVSVGRLFVTHPQGRDILSGGSAGPEGSIFATIALLLTIVVIHFTMRPGMQAALDQGPQPQLQQAHDPELV